MVGKIPLGLYKGKLRPAVNRAYDGLLWASVLFKARACSLEVWARTCWWNGIGDRCGVCGEQARESDEHLLLRRTFYEKERRELPD